MVDPPQSTQAGAATITIPEETKKQFTELVELILKSESMNMDERQYWISILPLMTPEQRNQLKKILSEEREQLAAIDAKYAKAIDNIGSEEMIKKTSEERERNRKELQSKEEGARLTEEKTTEDILEKINEQSPEQPAAGGPGAPQT